MGSIGSHLHAVAELALQLEVPGRDPVPARLRGGEGHLVLEVEDAALLEDERARGALAAMLRRLAGHGRPVRVEHRGEVLLGQVRELRAVRPRTMPTRAWTRSSSLSTSQASPTVVAGRSATGR